MTALDQAFIKAFARQDRPSVAIPPPSAPAGGAGREAWDEGEAVSLSTSDIFDGVLAALEKPPSRATGHGPGFRVQGPGFSRQGSGARGQGSELTEHVAPNPEPRIRSPESPSDSCDVMEHPDSAASAERPSTPEISKSPNPQIPKSLNPQIPESPNPQIPNSEAPPAPPEFKPAWQVDRFTWPMVCRRLMTRAADEFDRLADALVTASSQGQKVLAVAGCRRGEGATTLLLCAARQLAERGIKAALVDADPVRPRLAKCLGVEPQLGWDETSETEAGRSADQALIEATANGLALTSVREPSGQRGPASGDWSRLASCLDVLRDHYEMVLVDPGPLGDADSADEGPFRAAGGHVDAVLLVHSRRVTSEEQLSAVQRQLTASGIAVAGLIENFVAL